MVTFGTVICTYNRSLVLEQCLSSWSRSHRAPEQFIVVDASPDAAQSRDRLTQQFPQLFSAADSDYIVTHQPGLTRQRNLGLAALNTDIACFADDDTFITEPYVSRIVEVFERDQQQRIGGVNGVAKGQFDNPKQNSARRIKNAVRHQLGWVAQRIRIPASHTHVHEPIPSELSDLPLIHIDRLWGANMNYRTELVRSLQFDEHFQRYGLFEDVDLSVRVGQTHKLVCRTDAELEHDDSLGQTTRPNDSKYFLASWLNSAYIIEKLFPCNESRTAHQRFFQLLRWMARVMPAEMREAKRRTFGSDELFAIAQRYQHTLQQCSTIDQLQHTFVQLQHDILLIEPSSTTTVLQQSQ